MECLKARLYKVRSNPVQMQHLLCCEQEAGGDTSWASSSLDEGSGHGKQEAFHLSIVWKCRRLSSSSLLEALTRRINKALLLVTRSDRRGRQRCLRSSSVFTAAPTSLLSAGSKAIVLYCHLLGKNPQISSLASLSRCSASSPAGISCLSLGWPPCLSRSILRMWGLSSVMCISVYQCFLPVES